MSEPQPRTSRFPQRTVPEAKDIEISGAGLEEAFLQLTADPGETPEVVEAG